MSSHHHSVQVSLRKGRHLKLKSRKKKEGLSI
jgi:hypothetical protein